MYKCQLSVLSRKSPSQNVYKMDYFPVRFIHQDWKLVLYKMEPEIETNATYQDKHSNQR